MRINIVDIYLNLILFDQFINDSSYLKPKHNVNFKYCWFK